MPHAGSSPAVATDPVEPDHDRAGQGRPPARCRICDRALVTGVERVLERCESCPSTVDPQVLTALTTWRDDTARLAEVPGHAVLTDIVLLAIAEQRPDSIDRMSRIPGLRPDKVAGFGTEILRVIHSAPVVPASRSTANPESGH